MRIPGPNGEILESDPVGYRMVFTSTLGDTLRVVEYGSSDIPVTDDDWEGQLDRWRAFTDEYPGGSCGPIIRPERKRLIHNVFYADLGRLWVERVQMESSSQERFDIFEYDGKLVGKVVTPERTWEAPPFIRGDKVYLVTLDSLDVPFVHVLRFKESPSH